jgi:hypothetical protein
LAGDQVHRLWIEWRGSLDVMGQSALTEDAEPPIGCLVRVPSGDGEERGDGDRATEAFGLYALSGKVASFMSPALIALATMASGSQRIGIAPLILLFLIGLFLLFWVKPKGEMAA